jgi:hypothetical protein
MLLLDLLDQIRTHYLRLFEAELAVYADRGVGIVPEFAMEEGGQFVRDGQFAGVRCDALLLEGSSATPTFFTFDRIWNFSEYEFDLDGMTFRLAPIHWYGVDARISGDPDRIEKALVAWFEEAFQSVTGNWDPQLKHAAHGIHDIEILRKGFSRKGLKCRIDFGAAPVSAVANLLEELRLAGATDVAFGFDGRDR